MASSQINKIFYHARSISLPTTPHPIATQFDEQLCLLRSSQATSTSSSSSLINKLTGLNELYGFVDELLQVPSNQQSLSKIQAVLDRSLRLLDTYSTTKDVLQQSKERLQDIQSVLRRKCSGELNVTSEATQYLSARKTVKKTVKKCLKNIKESSKTDQTNVDECFLNDLEEITVDIFASLLSYIGGTNSQSKNSWSVVVKLIHKKSEKVSSVSQPSDFEAVDATLESLICQKKTQINIETIRNQMTTLASEIEELDEVLECLFRHLIKTRSNLLNILSN